MSAWRSALHGLGTGLDRGGQARLPESAVALSRLAGIEPDAWQEQVLLSTAPRLLLNCSRQVGKSTTTGTLAVHTALTQPQSLILLLSPGLRQSGELFKKCLHVYQAAGRAVPAESETALTLTLTNGSRILSLPGNEETIRGFSGVRLLVLDEASRVADALYYSVRPMLAVSQGRLVAMSTPFGKRGWWYEAWARGGDAWERHSITAEQCSRITPEFLAEERRNMGDFWFQQEYMCQFLEGVGAAFTAADIDAALTGGHDPWDLLPNLS